MAHLFTVFIASLFGVLAVALPSYGQQLETGQQTKPAGRPYSYSGIKPANPEVALPKLNEAEIAERAAKARVFDGAKGFFGLHPFYTLPPFVGRIISYEILDKHPPRKLNYRKAGNDGASGELISGITPTQVVSLKILVQTPDNVTVIDNFEIDERSLAEIDHLLQQGKCNLPLDIWRLRYSRVFD